MIHQVKPNPRLLDEQIFSERLAISAIDPYATMTATDRRLLAPFAPLSTTTSVPPPACRALWSHRDQRRESLLHCGCYRRSNPWQAVSARKGLRASTIAPGVCISTMNRGRSAATTSCPILRCARDIAAFRSRALKKRARPG
jgi:hypothetical protein